MSDPSRPSEPAGPEIEELPSGTVRSPGVAAAPAGRSAAKNEQRTDYEPAVNRWRRTSYGVRDN